MRIRQITQSGVTFTKYSRKKYSPGIIWNAFYDLEPWESVTFSEVVGWRPQI